MNEPKVRGFETAALAVFALAGCGKTSMTTAVPSPAEQDPDPVTVTPVATLAPAMPEPPKPKPGIADGDAVPPPPPAPVPTIDLCRMRAGCMHGKRPIEGRIRRIGRGAEEGGRGDP